MWSLHKNNLPLKPLIFSNGKSQEDVVKETIDSINKGDKIIFIKGVCGSGKCLDKDSLIFCKPLDKEHYGYYKISELLDKKGKILSVNNEGNIIESNFKNVRKTGKKKLYKLKTRTGREITASKNHPFLTITKNGTEWQPLEKLGSDSYICLPNQLNLKESASCDGNVIKILAHLIAEGKLGDKTGSPRYYQDPIINKGIREDYETALKNLFPEGEVKSYSGKDVVIKFGNMDTRFGTTNRLRLLIREYGLDGKRSNEKFIPKIVFNLNKDKIALFLSRLFSCDGSIYEKKTKNRKKQIIVEYTSISDKLIKDVSLLLLRFGIQHTITSKRFRDNPNYSKRITISNQKQVREYIEQIGFIGRKQRLAEDLYKGLKNHKFTNIDKVPRIVREYLKNKGHTYNELDRYLNYEEIEKLRKNIGYKRILKDKAINTPRVFKQGKIDFLREHLREVNNYIKDNILSFICNENIVWDKIKSIEFIKEDETYDLEVPNCHNFIANGIIVHNSAIALNLARHLGKTSIVVPIKSLQEQYIKDYSNDFYVLDKANKNKLRISSILGRNNFKCNYIKEKNLPEKNLVETDLKLFNIFEKRAATFNKEDDSCDNSALPCKIEIKEKNIGKIKHYIKENPLVKNSNFSSISEVKRMSIAPACEYYSPILPKEFEINFKNSRKTHYPGLNEKEFTIHQRKPGCPFYDQYHSYHASDVIIFNSLKYKLESIMDRKPKTEVEIIDECDEFLDSFANIENISLNRLSYSLGTTFTNNPELQKIIDELINITNSIKEKYGNSQEILGVTKTIVEELLLIFLRNSDLLKEIEPDESSYLFHLEKVAKIFYDFLNESFFSVEKLDNDIVLNIVTTNLKKRFQELSEKNKVVILMSGTLHSESVLRNIFGLTEFKIVDAETKNLGELIKCRHGHEIDCKYSNFQSKKITREQYLKAFEKTIKSSKRPTLVHLTSFSDLPSELEKEELELFLPTRQEILNQQKNDPLGNTVRDFRNKKTNLLFTTKCNRGIDFPGDICNSIVISRFPYPNISALFWKILKKTNPENFMSFYMDKANRELFQKIYRGLRSKEDKVYLLSPDSRVLNFNI